MLTIWKFQLAVHDRPALWMPQGARILAVQAQHGVITMWAEVDSSAPTEERRFEIHGTGNPMPLLPVGHERFYVATVQLPPYVWHIYGVAAPAC